MDAEHIALTEEAYQAVVKLRDEARAGAEELKHVNERQVAVVREKIAEAERLRAEIGPLHEFVKIVDAYAVGLTTKEEVLESLDARLGRGPKKALAPRREGEAKHVRDDPPKGEFILCGGPKRGDFMIMVPPFDNEMTISGWSPCEHKPPSPSPIKSDPCPNCGVTAWRVGCANCDVMYEDDSDRPPSPSPDYKSNA